MTFREQVTLMKQSLNLWIGFVDVIRDDEFSLGTTENSGLRLINRNQSRYRLPGFGNDHLFP